MPTNAMNDRKGLSGGAGKRKESMSGVRGEGRTTTPLGKPDFKDGNTSGRSAANCADMGAAIVGAAPAKKRSSYKQ